MDFIRIKKDVKGIVIILITLLSCFFLVKARASNASILLEILIFTLGLFSLVKAAEIFTDLSSALGEILGFSKFATGVLIIAVGTSAPELFASVSAAMKNEPGMAVGNMLGTVVANSLLGIGFGAIFAKNSLSVHRDVFGTQMSIFLTAVFLLLGSFYDGELSWYEGAILVFVLVFYLSYVFLSSEDNEKKDVISNLEDSDSSEKNSIFYLFLLLVISLLCLFSSGDFVVGSLIESAIIMSFPGDKLATSILAIGTSIPEIATAIMLVRKNDADGLFGEIIGSNIIGLLGILGGIALFTPLSMNMELLTYLGVSLFFMFIITSVIMNDREINKIEGVSLIALFVLFTIQLIKI